MDKCGATALVVHLYGCVKVVGSCLDACTVPFKFLLWYLMAAAIAFTCLEGSITHCCDPSCPALIQALNYYFFFLHLGLFFICHNQGQQSNKRKKNCHILPYAQRIQNINNKDPFSYAGVLILLMLLKHRFWIRGTEEC